MKKNDSHVKDICLNRDIHCIKLSHELIEEKSVKG